MEGIVRDFPPLPETDAWQFIQSGDDDSEDGPRLVLKSVASESVDDGEEWANLEFEPKVAYATVAASVVLQQDETANDRNVPDLVPMVVDTEEEDAASDTAVVPEASNVPAPAAVSNAPKVSDEDSDEEDESEEESEEESEKENESTSPSHASLKKSREGKFHAFQEESTESLATLSEQLADMHKSSHRAKYDNERRQKRREKRLQREMKLNTHPSASEFSWTPKEDGRVRPNLHPKQVDHEMQKQWKKLMKDRRMNKSWGNGYCGRRKAVVQDFSL